MVAGGYSRGMELQAGPQLEVRAVPGILKALGMLAMTHQEVSVATDQCLAENPVLERADGHPCPGCGRHVASGTCYRCREKVGSLAFRNGTEAGVDPFRTLEADARLEVRSDCRTALQQVMAHLTPRGTLDTDPDEISRLHGLETGQVTEAIRALRAAGPPGIATASITDLLAAQAEALVAAGQAPVWLPRLVREHLDDLAAGSTADVARSLGLSGEQVLQGLATVRERLRPFAAFESGPADTVVPSADVFLYRARNGEVEVEVPGSAWFGLTMANLSEGLHGSAEAAQWLATHELAAQRLIYQVDRRANILLRVTECAVARQKDFLDHGERHHRPLTRTAVAQDIGLHPSTVSRAVHGKRVRLPSGVIADLSCLFGKGVGTRTVLQGLLSGAPEPVSDRVLSEELSRQGFGIARRTVTKYRHALLQKGTAGTVPAG